MIILGSVNVRQLLLELARHNDVDTILNLAVKTLTSSNHVAMARIWLVEEGDSCSSCSDSAICAEKKQCLHLRASAGHSLHGSTQWNSVRHSSFIRFPMGVRKVGKIAESGEAIEVIQVNPTMDWVADPQWIKREKIIGFAGQPLRCRDQTLGVLAVFSRHQLEQHALDLLRMIADHLAYALANATSFATIEKLTKQVEAENSLLRNEIIEAGHFEDIVGESTAMENIRSLVRMVSPTDANVLITGESGTGKEMIARDIHRQSLRHERPMIKINCAAIPRDLFESEFFGHARGAFTGAIKKRVGYFEAADQGTLFLDEIGEMPLEMQSKLLRVLQEGEYLRVGEEKSQKANVRIIAATNRNLFQSVQKGIFREDLYYRLQVFPIQMPSLRDRKSDIPLLVEHFTALSCKRLNQPLLTFTPSQLKIFEDYEWPGNIRELQNIVERISITRQAEPVLEQLAGTKPPHQETASAPVNEQTPSLLSIPTNTYSPERLLTEQEIRDLEKRNTLEALRQTNGIIYGPRGAAKLLGINPTTLMSRLKKWDRSAQ